MAVDRKLAVGLRIRTAREARDLTQEDLAAAVDRTVYTISNIERGKSASSIDTLGAIAAHLGLPLKELFDFEDIGPRTTRREVEARARIAALLRGLTGADLDVALKQIEALASRGR